MAIAKLDANQNVVLNSNSQMDYVTKADEKKLMAAKTAAINILEEAIQAKSLGIEKLNVSFKQSIDGAEPKWQSYWLNVQKNGNVSLKPLNSEIQDGSDLIYFNKVEKDGKSFYMLNDQNAAGKNFVDSLATSNWQDKEGNEHTNLAARVNILDKDLKKALIDKGEGAYAVISKEGVSVTTKQEQNAAKATTQNKEQPSKDNER
ncbi:hypothetical protein [uncultured Helicobacter sp.]|uniref:hypothetical protein n=1 Tax=uncultured Helicobacter sp. TaxID=175537 RepID=UPI003751244C